MRKKSIFWYLMLGLVAFIFSSGFLGMCVGPDYRPGTIAITDPVDGTVLEPGTESVLIHGKVIPGDSEVWLLKAMGKSIPFDSASGEFEYEFALDPDSIYSTCTFEVKDKKWVVNKERVSYAVGESAQPWTEGVVDDAARLFMTDGFMDVVAEEGSEFINTWKNDAIYGWDAGGNPDYSSHDENSPFRDSTPLLPYYEDDIIIDHDYEVETDHQGFVNLGLIALSADIRAGDIIDVDISVSAESWVNPRSGSDPAAVFIQGEHDCWWLGYPHFTFWAESLTIDGARLSLSVDEDNMIIANIDLGDIDVSWSNAHIEYGILGGEIPDWLETFIADIIEEALADIVIDIPIINIEDIAVQAEGIEATAWPMNPTTIFTSTENDMTIDIGVGERVAEGVEPVNPGLDKFYATPDDVLPDLSVIDDENLILALTDDLTNQSAFVFTQAGLVQDVDVTDIVGLELSLLGGDLVAFMSINTPPICDFSGQGLKGLDVSDAGRFILPNVIIEIYGAAHLPPGYPYRARISVDANMAVKLEISEDGTNIQAFADLAQSESQAIVLYDNLGNAALLPVIGKTIVNSMVDSILRSLINIDIPLIDFYGSTISVAITGTELSNNCLITRMNVDNP
ncbi:MAG: hypothetical protein J7L53_09515 [Deltaproteobacteria bacterium]|nr:hypothetical protein [Deltaproteobacteria bacterium]